MLPCQLFYLFLMNSYEHQACKSHIDSGEDWQTMIRKGSNQAGGSALTGDWKPMDAAPQPEPTPPAPTPAAQPQPAVSRFAPLWLDSNAWIPPAQCHLVLQFLLWSLLR